MTAADPSPSRVRDVVVLDARDLQPRDRHETIFETLSSLDAGETLRLVNDHDPVPLRYQLEAEYPDKHSWVTVEAGPERWTVDITSRARVVDARPILAVGDEPYETIMQAAAATGDDQVLVVYAPFEPIPLQGVLAEQGFDHVTEQLSDDTWRVRFKRP